MKNDLSKYGLFSMLFWSLFLMVGIVFTPIIEQNIERKQSNIEVNEAHVICDVVEYYDAEENTVLVCEMPNGELHEYYIEDAPEGDIDIVCLRTENQNDYTMYEVVAVR